jgi:hypothetical protein
VDRLKGELDLRVLKLEAKYRRRSTERISFAVEVKDRYYGTAVPTSKVKYSLDEA